MDHNTDRSLSTPASPQINPHHHGYCHHYYYTLHHHYSMTCTTYGIVYLYSSILCIIIPLHAQVLSLKCYLSFHVRLQNKNYTK